MKLLLRLILSVLIPLAGSCSMVVATQGKRIDTVFKTDANRKSIQRHLGKPVESQEYPHPRDISELPEFMAASENVISEAFSLEGLATGYEDYCYNGLVYDEMRMMFYGVAAGTTVGLSEVWAVPHSVSRIIKSGKMRHYFRVWYRGDKYQGYLWIPPDEFSSI